MWIICLVDEDGSSYSYQVAGPYSSIVYAKEQLSDLEHIYKDLLDAGYHFEFVPVLY